MHDTPLFSVVIPSYNRESTIYESILCVLRQSLQAFECIVVDDCSSDKTVDIVRSFADNRIKLYIHNENMGQIGAWKTAIRHASGIYIALLDSDDLWDREMLLKQLKKYNSNHNISCVYTHTNFLHSDGSSTPNIRCNFEGDIYASVLNQGYLCHSSGIGFKKSCVSAIGMEEWDTRRVGTDDMLCFALAKHFYFGVIPEVLAYLRVGHNHRLSSSVRIAWDWWTLFNEYEEDILMLCGNVRMSEHFLRCCARFMSENGGYDLPAALKAQQKAAHIHDSLAIHLAGLILASEKSLEKKSMEISSLCNGNIHICK